MSLKVVVIGTGFGQNAAAPAYEALGCEVQVLSPRDADGIRRAVAQPCDLVSIHSPPFMHLEHVRLATEHRRAVLCDKPFGRNAAEAAQMLELAEAAKVPHFLNFEFRFDPLREKMKALLDAGVIGEPRHFSCSMHLSRGREISHGWLCEKEQGGGWIGAYASHIVDALHWQFGNIEKLSAVTRIDAADHADKNDPTIRHPTTAEDAVVAWFQLENGVTASLDTAFAAAVNTPNRITVLGTGGALHFTQGLELVIELPGREAERIAAPPSDNPVRQALEPWLAAVCRALSCGARIEPDFHSGLACAKVLDRLRS